ncbi:MAG TPA: restriction endonuclease subunit S [Nitrospiraceae bacterium]|nr:restriction endonuclease subunit S [Nitrospiraceae bacterium]
MVLKPGYLCPPGYKQTEVGVIPEDWDAEKLGNFVSLQRGHDLTWRDRRKGDVPVMGSAGQNGFHDTAIAKGPGVLLGRSGASFGQAHYCEKDFWPHNTALYVTDFRGNDRLFVFYFLKSIDFTRYNSGGAQQSLNRNFIYPIQVGVPRPPEQCAIAGALSDVDELIGTLDQLIAKKRDLKQATMQQLLTGQKRLPGFGKKDLAYKQSDVGVIPEDWRAVKIKDYASIKTGKRNTQDRIEEGEYPFFVRSQVVERIDSYSFDGEAVLTAGDGVGTGKVFHYINGRFDFHQRVYKISDFSSDLNGFFFFLVFSTRFYDRIMSMTAKSSVDSVRLEMIADMQIPLPPTEDEQTAIAEVLSDMDAELAALTQRRDKTRFLKQGMMQELLTGRTRLA